MDIAGDLVGENTSPCNFTPRVYSREVSRIQGVRATTATYCGPDKTFVTLQSEAGMEAGGHVYNARVERVKGKEAKEKVRVLDF